MRQKLIAIIAIVMIGMLTGCTSAGTEVVLESTASTVVSEASDESSGEGDSSFSEENVTAKRDSSFTGAAVSPVVVYVCGAVEKAGVYELPAGSRLNDAVLAAGGFDDAADRSYVNLAAMCEDGMKLYIPTQQEVEDSGGNAAGIAALGIDSGNTASEGSEGGNSPVNINTASKDELTTLPGIGAGYADRIIEYRNEKGPFKSIEDIMKVSGIKEKLFSRIRDKITV